MEDIEAKSILEAALFIAGEPMNVDSLKKILDMDKVNTERLLRELVTEYSLRNAGLLIVEVAESFQMVTSPACAPWIKKLLVTAIPKKLSPSSLETIAIIAYKQPIIKAEIEAIRGVNSDGVVKTLLERRLVKILGRKEAPGRPLLYGTTPEFLRYFGLKDLLELPTLKEFSEMDTPEAPETLPEDEDIQEAVEAFEESQAVEYTEEAAEPLEAEQEELVKEHSVEGEGADVEPEAVTEQVSSESSLEEQEEADRI